jgi:preprotein translocase subunit SecD
VAPPRDSNSRARAAGGGPARPGGGITLTRPGRYLATLAVLILVMLAAVIGGEIAHPGLWHTKFKVGLGLDLSSGTQVTLLAKAPHGTPTTGAMNESIAILNSRINSQGFTGATVQREGANNIVVSVPGKSAEQISPFLQSAVLRFRQVLLAAPGYPVPLSSTPTSPTPPAASPTPGTSGSPSPHPTPHSSGSPGAHTSPSPGASSGTQATGARPLAASPRPSPSKSTSPSPSPTPSPSPSFATRLPTVADASGNLTLVKSPAVIKDFNRLDCRHKNWQKQIYGSNPNNWDNPYVQIVSCDAQGTKYVLDVAKVQGTNLTSVSAGLNQNNQWVVNFNLDGQGTAAFSTLTSNMYSKYFDPTTQRQTSVLDQFAIVLDGKVQSAPQIIQPITTGSGEINGGTVGFTPQQANQLATLLKYGAVPLAFLPQFVNSISAVLGASQLHAGLIAGLIGFVLVMIYSLLYYRGLALVSVFSLGTAALLAWLAVVLLTKYQSFTLSLAGVAGMIVAIGITADSFVVFFERLRDEVREGRSLRAAVERGWVRARRTILVSDTVSFLAALLLYIFAIGDVRGFAFTLGLTTLIDVVVVFLFTKPMVTLLARTTFYGDGHKWSGLDPARLGARSPWRGSRQVGPPKVREA